MQELRRTSPNINLSFYIDIRTIEVRTRILVLALVMLLSQAYFALLYLHPHRPYTALWTFR